MNPQRQGLFRYFVERLTAPQLVAVYWKAAWFKSWNDWRARRQIRQARWDRDWEIFMDELLDIDPNEPLIPRPVRMAIYQTAISLPVSLTVSLYLLRSTEQHPMFFPMMIGMVSVTSLLFQFTARLVRLNW